mgnify:CR=1 FL=1|jgi:chromosome segregation ATPase
MSTKNEVFEYLIDQLRQQVTNNPYKQQCEDLAHEVLSLKNQLRDASAQIKELHKALARATGDVEAYKLIRKGEQSGCRKEDVPECKHEWYFYDKGASMMCRICGLKSPDRQKEDTQECEHDWRVVQYSAGAEINKCRLCGEEKEVHYE